MTDKVPRHVTKSGYVMVRRPGHPLAIASGYVYEHRLVRWEAAGGVAVPCFWCGAALTWKTTVVDHLNEIKHDNTPDNLLSACNDCNRARGAMLPFIRRLRPDALGTFIAAVRSQAPIADRRMPRQRAA